MIVTTFENWKSWAATYSVLPYVVKFSLRQDRIVSWEEVWRRGSESFFVLESGKSGRYTFLGLEPVSTIKGKGNDAEIDHKNGSRKIAVKGESLRTVKEWMSPFRTPKVDGAPKFIGGCVGYWSYDVVRSIENLPVIAEDDLSIPEYCFMRFHEIWAIDHEQKELYCAVHVPLKTEDAAIENQLLSLYGQAAARAEEMKRLWDEAAALASESENSLQRIQHYETAAKNDLLQIDVEAISGIRTLFKKEQYMSAVERIQEYIRQGDVFQVNLSVRQSKTLQSEPEDIYEWLRLFNPSPYMGFLRFPGFDIVSASPELLVKLENGEVSTRPIAGTRPRGKDEAEDRRLAEELIHHEKERAEHIMLVDLERNDLGKISHYGTVKVEELMVIEYYSHVMHIVSEVKGKLAEGKDAFDVIAATFPGGTITGAPKIRTMEIIEELEPVRRGPYTGSIGWIDYNGNMEFNIVIRTLLVQDGIGHIQAGAGIVIDSVPEKEYYESLNKAKALWKAIQYSEQMMSRAQEEIGK